MQEKPLVTIICLSYNHEKFVIESLNSVINQNYAPIELLIVDDFSTDNSKAVIENWLVQQPQVLFIANTNNLGNTKSFNNALKLAKGDYIIDLAADDVLLPNGIEMQVNAFQKSAYPNLGIVYGNAEMINENGIFVSNYFPINNSGNVIEKRITGDVYESILKTGNSICSVSTMIKKSVFEELNGYDETLAYEDLDLWIRASRKYDFDFIDSVLIKKRIVSNSLGSQFFKRNHKINQSTYKILKKALQLNESKSEDLALQKRIHYEIIHSFRTKNIDLLLKNLFLRLEISWRKGFKKYN